MIKNKKELIIIGCSVIALIAILIAVLIPKNKDLILYDTKYLYEGNYFIFKKDNTCIRGYVGSDTTNCTYEIKDNNITTLVKEEVLGIEISTEMLFHINNTKELSHYLTKIDNIEMTNGTYGNIWSINGNTTKQENNEETNEEENNNKAYYKTYLLLELKGGKKATITFNDNNICEVNFREFNNKQKAREYFSVTYNDGLCTYKELTDHQLEVKYKGTLSITYTYYVSNKQQVKDMGSHYTMENAIIEFNDDYSKIEFKNGKWDGKTGEFFYYYYLTNEEEKEIKEENNTNNNSSNEDNEESYSEKKEKEELEKEKEKINNLTVRVETTDDKFELFLDNTQTGDIYDITINNKEARVTYFGRPIYSSEYTKVGEECIDVNIKGYYGATRTIKACVNEQPQAPNYGIVQDTKQDNKCIIRILPNVAMASYNRSITVTQDGQEISSNGYISENVGTHTYVITNKVGLTQELTHNCNNN